MRTAIVRAWLLAAVLIVVSAGYTPGSPNTEEQPGVKVRYVEIVCNDVAAQCTILERVHGLSFGPEVVELGNARVAGEQGGSLIGVRAPLAEHELPITRTYLVVEDIAKAVKEAEAAGATIAYPPTRQGETGTWAIYIVGDGQFGLWQP